MLVLDNLIDVTGTPTMILHFAFLFVPFTFAVMIAVPFFLAVIVPFWVTVAVFLLLDVQIIFFCVDFFGLTVAFNFIFLPFLLYKLFCLMILILP